MRIIYDDTMQKEFVKIVDDYIYYIKDDILRFVKYDYGMDRVQRNLVLKDFDEFLYYNSKFQRGKSVVHANGIGNNCLYPVYYKAKKELQQCANINFNTDGYGNLYISIEDYNKDRVGNAYRISTWGVRDIIQANEAENI